MLQRGAVYCSVLQCASYEVDCAGAGSVFVCTHELTNASVCIYNVSVYMLVYIYIRMLCECSYRVFIYIYTH